VAIARLASGSIPAGDPAAGIGSVVSAGAILAITLVLVAWTHVRLDLALERARQAGGDLDASEARYRTLVESAPDGIVVIDATTMRAVTANRRAAAMFGIASSDELVPLFPDQVMSEPQRGGRSTLEAVREAIRATVAGTDQLVVLDLRRLDGTPFTAEVQTSLVTIAGRTEVRLSLIDVTERVAALRERDVTEARFRSLFASSPTAILLVDGSGRIVDASDLATGIFGYSTDELRARTVEDLVLPAQRSDHRRQRVEFDASPATRAMGHAREVTALRADGSSVPVEIGLSWFESEEGRFATAVVIDISARRAAERVVREANETIRALFDASPAGIAVTDLDGTVRLWNQAMAQLSGVAAEDAIGRFDPSVPEDRLASRAAIRAAIARAETVTGADLILRRPDDSTFPAVGSFGPLHDDNTKVIGIVSVVEDVTAMRNLEAQVNRKVRLEAVGQLAGGIAHDINNVLTAIGGFAALSLDDLDAGRPVDRESIATIAEGAARTSALTRQLLAFARRDIRPAETLSLGESVRAVEPMLRGLIGEHIKLTMSTKDTGHVRIAGSQVEQLVINLVVNARDALPAGGTIRVEVDNVAVSDDAIGGHLEVKPGPYVALSVTDDGTGMSPEVAERVFDPFFTTKGPDVGTGLGLATVHGIVTGAGGHVWLYTAEGVGTTFRILLPQTAETLAEPRPRIRSPRTGTETVLLVEDEDIVRSLATRVLERAGFTVLAAAGASEAIEVAAGFDGRIDLLLTDVIMPGVLGPELAVRLAEARPGLRVLFTSGYTAGGAGVTASLPPDARFIDKPFSPPDLVAAVRAAIDDPSADKPG
jgi:PAS domain S-box-containing protein